jgi:THO complex subunit 2
LANNEKERLASEEAEKRLKAALTAKRDPATTTSRIGSPAVGDTTALGDSVQSQQVASQGEDVSMSGTEPSQPIQPQVSIYTARPKTY